MVAKTDGTKCAHCKKKPEEQKCHLMIECDCCNLWYHTQCQNLSKTEASLISEGVDKGIIWLCTTCKPTAVIKSTKTAKTTDEKLDAISSSIKILQEKLDHANTVHPVPDTPYRDALQSMKAVEENTKRQQILLQKSIETNEAENRKTNAILYGIPETTEKSVLDQVQEFMTKECFIHESKPISAYRLGTKSNEIDKHRPIKIRFVNEDAKWVFMKRVNHQFKGTKTFCLLDRSKQVRDEEYKLRQTAKKLTSEGNGMNFRARELKIQVQHEGEWRDMKKDTTGKWVMSNSKNTNC